MARETIAPSFKRTGSVASMAVAPSFPLLVSQAKMEAWLSILKDTVLWVTFENWERALVAQRRKEIQNFLATTINPSYLAIGTAAFLTVSLTSSIRAKTTFHNSPSLSTTRGFKARPLNASVRA